ncbi:MAG: hypothetical protein QM765_15740 [Myxococcales bacterium]
MRRSMVTVAALSTIGILALARCGNNNGNADTGGGTDAVAAANDAQVALDAAGAGDATTGAVDAAVGQDAAAAGLDAQVAGADATVALTPIVDCVPLANYGCDAGLCLTTAIAPNGQESFACGEPGTLGSYANCVSGLAGQCETGSTCVVLPVDAGTVCHQYCNSTTICPETAPQPQMCMTPGTGPVGYCLQVEACSLYTQDCANAAKACYPVSSGTGGCVDKGTKALGATCSRHEECLPGLICPPDSTSMVCRTVCDPSAATDTCTNGLTCTPQSGRTWGSCK